MAVIVAETATNLSSINGFYRAEAYNVVQATITDGPTLATSRDIPITFANAGNCRGMLLFLETPRGGGTYTKPVTVDLQQIFTPVTINIANPCVITYTSFGLADGTGVVFTTTGALPTGLSLLTYYYTYSTGANTFNLYDTYAHAVAGGSTGRVVTSGSQSGTQTMWATRTTQTVTAANIDSATVVLGCYIVPFLFAPYAVDTTTGKWRFFVSQGAGTTNWNATVSSGTTLLYVTWCDAAVTATSGSDALVAVGNITIDETFTLKAHTGGFCAISCRSIDATPDNVCNFIWENPPSSSYTLTIDGAFVLSSHGGFRCGTSTNPIPTAQKAIIIHTSTPTIGTWKGFHAIKDYYGGTRTSLFFYGEVPAKTWDTLAADANLNQKNIVTSTSTGWSPTDIIYIGREDGQGFSTGLRTQNTINSISGPNITLTNNITGNGTKRWAGGLVINFSNYGIELKVSATSVSSYLHQPSNFTFSGCHNTGWLFMAFYGSDFKFR